MTDQQRQLTRAEIMQMHTINALQRQRNMALDAVAEHQATIGILNETVTQLRSFLDTYGQELEAAKKQVADLTKEKADLTKEKEETAAAKVPSPNAEAMSARVVLDAEVVRGTPQTDECCNES